MNESTTSISVLAVSALAAIGFFASFGGQFVDVTHVASALVAPGVIFLLVVAAVGLIRILLTLSES